ncbi:MAG: hypothetical protein R3E48_12360 [Burkholderiaceae bacterium]
MEEDIEQLDERIRRLVGIVRRLADENSELRAELQRSESGRAALSQRMRDASRRVEAALARLPLKAEQAG